MDRNRSSSSDRQIDITWQRLVNVADLLLNSNNFGNLLEHAHAILHDIIWLKKSNNCNITNPIGRNAARISGE
jgi:hypothetical protein